MAKHMGKWCTASAVTVLAIGVLLTSCIGAKNEAAAPAGSGRQQTDGQSAERPEITVSVYDRGNIPAEEGTVTRNRWTDWINANSPVQVKFVPIPRWESETKFNTLFATGKAPDLIMEYSTAYTNQLYAQNLLLPLDGPVNRYAPDYNALLHHYPVLRKLGTKADGKLYGLGGVSPIATNHVLFIRADWLKKLNLEVPTTTEQFYEVAKAFAEQDPDGNGKKDTYGMNLSFVGGGIVNAMFGYSEWKVENGAYVHAWDRAKATYELKKRLYDGGLVDPYYLTDKNGERAQQDFVTGKLGMFGANGGAGAQGLKLYETFKKNVPDGEIVPIALPQSRFGQYSPAISPSAYITAVVNAKAINPETVLQYVNFLVQPSTIKTLRYGIEGVHYVTGSNGCPQVVNADKSKREVDWNLDFRMLSSSAADGECDKFISQLNPDNPTEKRFGELIQAAEAAYISPDRPVYYDIDASAQPHWPEQLQIIVKNATKAISDIWSKAVVSGPSYTIDQAFQDAKSAWDNAGGAQLDDYLAGWYAANKEKVVHTKDWYGSK
jgi:putative aldouronate transport system substrate-binding protein